MNLLFQKSKFLTPKKIKKIADKKNTFIYDMRTMIEFKEGHLKNSIHVDYNLIEKVISERKFNDLIIIIDTGLRKQLPLIRKFKNRGFKHIYLPSILITNWPDRTWIKK